MTYNNLHQHSSYSLLDGICHPDKIAKRYKELGYINGALSDHGGISGCIEFYQECKKLGIKPILGVEAYHSVLPATIKDKNNRKLNHILIYAKNLAGWKKLVKLVSRSNQSDVFYYKPRIDLDILKELSPDGDMLCISGHIGSTIAYEILDKDTVRSDAEQRTINLCHKYWDIFGKDNFFLEVQLIDQDFTKPAKVLADVVRQVAKKLDIKSVATADSHYSVKADAVDQRLLLCSALKTTLPKVNSSLEQDDDVSLGGFFISDNFHIPSIDEIAKVNTEEEIENTNYFASLVEEYNILSKPLLPKFPVADEFEHLKRLCEYGWSDILQKYNVLKDKQTEDLYRTRLNHELEVIKKAGLSGYFLIVQDYINWCRQKNWFMNSGRGSVAGSLVAYLSKITMIDPIPHNLLFTRFYNEGRNTKDHVSLPDIDVDVPKFQRENIIDYISSKYGSDKVGHICTFGRLMGKGAIKEVLRVQEACSFEMMNKITQDIPDEGRIADQMQNLGETSILQFILKNEPKLLEDYCHLTDDGKLEGEFAPYFEQAIRIEGVYKSIGKHAAGIVISDEPLTDVCPMVNTGDQLVIGWDMYSSESVGITKFDILGVTIYDKLNYVNNLLNES